MICIHPGITHKPASIIELQRETGLTIVHGNKYARLEQSATAKKIAAMKARMTETHCARPLLICSRCEFQSSAQNAHEKCRHCRNGVMLYPFDGGSAA